MKTIEFKEVNEKIYYEKLSNGLDVYLYVKEDCYNNYVTFTTKFGSVYSEIPLSEKLILPKGIAHFLEHKVFAQKKDPQPEDFFASNGAVFNAYTTFKNTSYLFSGPDNLGENLKYLLDYVQNPYFTDKNIEKEKGIITQEIHMCDDRPSDILYDKIRENSLHKNSFKDSIIGTVNDINKINKNLLTKCYNTYYNPNNMFLVVTGNFNIDEIFNIIKENQNNKEFKETKAIDYEIKKEIDKVVKVKEIVNIKTNIPKLAYTIKIPVSKYDIDKRKLNLYLYILFSCLFDDTSVFDEEMKKKKIIINTLSLNLLYVDTHLLISLINETQNYDKLITEIDNRLKNLVISNEDLERKKKVLISNEIFSFENIEMINEMIIDNIIFDNRIENNNIELIKSLNINELNNIIKNINVSNKSIVIIEKDK